MVVEYYFRALDEGGFYQKRAQQNRDWLHQLINEMLLLKLSRSAEVKQLLPVLEQEVEADRKTAYTAAREIIALL